MAVRADDIDLARDRRLVEAWQAGDDTAFDDLYRRYFGRLRAFCQRRVSDPAEADDLAQEAFLKALKALPHLDGERRFYPWMTVIASRLCIDHHRRSSRVQPSDDIDLGSVDDGHEERDNLRADLHNLDLALGRLGPRHVEVLDLRESRGLTYDQIAAQLNVSHSTVETLLFRARRALRREFVAVSGERLASLPAVGWLVTKGVRLRDRVAAAGPDLGALGGTLAAGAVTAVIVTFPAAPGPPPPVVTVGPRQGAVTLAASSVPAVPAPTPELHHDTAPPPEPGPAPLTRVAPRAPVRTMTPEEAEREASDMPLHLDLQQLGAGIDPDPLLAPVLDSSWRQP